MCLECSIVNLSCYHETGKAAHARLQDLGLTTKLYKLHKTSNCDWLKAIISIVALAILMQFALAASFTQYYPTANQTGAFYNGSVITYDYTGSYSCYPPLSSISPSATTNESAYPCYAGIASNSSQALPDWILVPAYAGMSVFGVNGTNGMPVFRNSTVYVNCGAGNSSTMCASDPKFVYSPDFAMIENSIGVRSFEGLPNGIMPLPAHSHLINDTFHNDPIPWYVVIVYVLDPNIMPNVTNGKCTQVVASNVSNPTVNCLTSLAAIKRAMQTEDNATINANIGNPVWDAMGKPSTEVYIPNDTSQSEVGKPNTNMVIPFAAESYNFYSSKQTSSLSTTIVSQSSRHAGSATDEITVLAIIIVIAVALYAVLRSKGKKH